MTSGKPSIFGASRPLNDFSSKITMAYALKIISKDVYDELEKIRAIRNAFAHSAELLHFDSERIAPLFASLKRPQSKATDPSTVFLACAKAIETALKDYLRMGDDEPS